MVITVPAMSTEITAKADKPDAGEAPDGSSVRLFRPEALAAAAGNSLGRPIALLPVGWGVLTGILLSMAIGFTATLFLGTYTRKESAIGIVRTAGGDVAVAVPSAGIVRQVGVSEGQNVRAGQMLLLVDTTRSATDGQLKDENTIQSLDREISSLRERLTAIDRAADIEGGGMPARLSALKREREAAVAQESAGRERLRLAEEAILKIEPVAARGFISAEAMRRRKEEVIGLRQMISDALGGIARLDGQISAALTADARRPMATVRERGEILDLLSRSRRERDLAVLQRGFAIVAPTAGVVSAVQVGVGQSVDPQRIPMTISTPSVAPNAEIFVPSRAIGFIEPGQKVRIRYDAFPYQRFGSAEGTIKSISSTVLRPQDIEAAVRAEEPMYRVVLALDRNTITAYGKTYRIRPGIALTADIVLDERSFADWLLDPVRALRGRL